jgi:hypothetical protein
LPNHQQRLLQHDQSMMGTLEYDGATAIVTFCASAPTNLFLNLDDPASDVMSQAGERTPLRDAADAAPSPGVVALPIERRAPRSPSGILGPHELAIVVVDRAADDPARGDACIDLDRLFAGCGVRELAARTVLAPARFRAAGDDDAGGGHHVIARVLVVAPARRASNGGTPRRARLGALELRARCLPAGPALRLFDEYDGDADGTLSRAEFCAFVHDLKCATKQN